MATPFKMKSSPTKGKLGDFFKGLGKEGTKKRQDAQRAKNEGGLTNFEKRQAAKQAARKGNVKPKAKVTKVKPGAATGKGATTGNDKVINIKTKNNLTLGTGTAPTFTGGDQNKKGTGKYKANTYTRSGKSGSTSVVTPDGKRRKIKGDIKDYTKEGGNTFANKKTGKKVRVKVKVKK